MSRRLITLRIHLMPSIRILISRSSSTISFLLVLLVYSPNVSGDPSQETAPGPRVEVDSSTVDLGVLAVGDSAAGEFVIRNSGSKTLVLKLESKSCHCLTDIPTPLNIEPGESYLLELRRDLAVESVGRMSLTVTLSTNDPATPTILLNVKYRVTSGIEVEPVSLEFGRIRSGEVHVRHLTLRSFEGNIPLHISSIKVSSPRIEVTEVDLNSQDETTRKLAITFIQSGGAPRVSETIVIETASETVPFIEVPVRAELIYPFEVKPSALSYGSIESQPVVSRIVRLIPRQGKTDRLPATLVSGDPSLRGSLIRNEASEAGWAVEVVLEPPDNPGRFKSHIAVYDGDGKLLAWIPVYAVVRPKR